MNNETLISMLEEAGISQNQIDEIMGVLEREQGKIPTEGQNPARNQVLGPQKALNDEEDWQKRAKIAAQIIRDNLEAF